MDKMWFFFLFFLCLGMIVPGHTMAQEPSHDNPMKIAREAFESGEYGEAIKVLSPYLEQTLENHQLNPGDQEALDLYSSALYLLGDCYWWQGDYNKTEEMFVVFLDLVRRHDGEENNNYINRTGDLAALYYELGRYDESETLFIKCLELDEKINGEIHLNRVNSWNNLALLYEAQARYREAEVLYQKVLKSYGELLGKNHPHYATALSNLTVLYNSMGRYQQALPLLIEARQIQKSTSGEQSAKYATVTNNLAMIYFALREYDLARELLEESIQIRKKILGESSWDYLISLSNLSRIYLEENEPEKALELTGNILKAYKDLFGDLHPSYLNTLTNQAAAYLKLGEYEIALSLLEEVADKRKQVFGQDHPDYVQSLSHLAMGYIGAGDLDKAEFFLLESMEKYKNQVQALFPGLSEWEQEQFYEIIQGKLEAFNSFVVMNLSSRPYLAAVMFDNLLFSKSLLLDRNRKIRESINNSGDGELIKKFNQWKILREQWAKLIKQDQTATADHQSLLDSISLEINFLEKDINLGSASFSGFTEEVPKWKDIQAQLKEYEAVVEIIRFRKYDMSKGGRFLDSVSYAALILKPHDSLPNLVLLENGNLLEGRIFQAYQRSIRELSVETLSFNYFWEPVYKYLGNSKRIFLSSDGIYHQLNPNTFYMADSNAYLGDMLDIHLLISSRELLDSKHKASNDSKVSVLFANPDFGILPHPSHRTGYSNEELQQVSFKPDLPPLPATQEEVDQINRLLWDKGFDVKVFTSQNATKKNLFESKRPFLVHLATHGFFEQDTESRENLKNPMLRSGLYLSAGHSGENPSFYDSWDEMDDGRILTAYEAVSLDLEGTELVVLSACETGLGDIRFGEGVDGLQRAFKLAGAETLLMSLWKIDDIATQKLMTGFYGHWINGLTKQQAFKRAQLELREEYPAPYFWGAFVMVGK